MTIKVFVDGQEGTTGLRIFEFLAARPEITVLRIDEEQRKDLRAREALINESDVTFLCLPDAASRESAGLVRNPDTRVIDASTAFRTSDDWAYGLPELTGGQRALIAGSRRVAVPGCHASAFLLSVRPLVEGGLLPIDCSLASYSITGYSGGGKKMIADYERGGAHLHSPRPYALSLEHKHLPEMQFHGRLAHAPIFTPIVGNFYKGLAVTTYLDPQLARGRLTPASVHAALAEHYAGERFIRVAPLGDEGNLDGGFFDVQGANDTNRVDLFVFGNAQRIVTIARLDNLGKGASGAAIQCMNLMMDLDEGAGLVS